MELSQYNASSSKGLSPFRCKVNSEDRCCIYLATIEKNVGTEVVRHRAPMMVAGLAGHTARIRGAPAVNCGAGNSACVCVAQAWLSCSWSESFRTSPPVVSSKQPGLSHRHEHVHFCCLAPGIFTQPTQKGEVFVLFVPLHSENHSHYRLQGPTKSPSMSSNPYEGTPATSTDPRRLHRRRRGAHTEKMYLDR